MRIKTCKRCNHLIGCRGIVCYIDDSNDFVHWRCGTLEERQENLKALSDEDREWLVEYLDQSLVINGIVQSYNVN